MVDNVAPLEAPPPYSETWSQDIEDAPEVQGATPFCSINASPLSADEDVQMGVSM